MSQDNGRGLLWVVVVASVLLCGGAAFGLPYFLGPEAQSRSEMILRTPTATPPPTPHPDVVAAQVKTAETQEQAVRTTLWGLVILGLGIVAAIALQVWTKSLEKVKAARSLPAHALLPDGANLLAMTRGWEVYDPRFGSVRVLEQGDASPCLEQGELLVNRAHPAAEIVQALLAVASGNRGPAWQAAARYYLEDGRETE